MESALRTYDIMHEQIVSLITTVSNLKKNIFQEAWKGHVSKKLGKDTYPKGLERTDLTVGINGITRSLLENIK